jgi:hypothetical protein
MARRLDNDLLRNLSVQVALPLELRELKDAETYWPGWVAEVRTHQDSTVRILDSETIAGLLLLNNLWGKPDYVLEVRDNRDIWHEGLRSARLLALCLIAVVVIFSSLDIVNANKAVVKPVESLGQFIQTFRNDHGLRTRVELAGTAEIVQLGEQINQMIDEI